MKVLVVGSGGRESALALGLSRSPSVSSLLAAPGNPGMGAFASLAEIAPTDVEALVELARGEGVDLVVAGPESSLAAGLADALAVSGIPCFGPGRAAARIETSKAFSKAFMGRHGIPSPGARVFTSLAEALDYALSMSSLPVLKASGLCAGKGVFLPAAPAEIKGQLRRLFELGPEVLVEERLEGQELSLLALCDGSAFSLMPAARDHKRLLEGERGPNTGGMGSYAPALSAPLAEELAELVIAPAVRGLAEEGSPFVGVLFAGLMLCTDGPRVLEYNCRFGDPEAQAILPLLDSDLGELLLACAEGRLGSVRPHWGPGAATCLVLAAEGYPEAPRTDLPLSLPPELPPGASLLHAATRLEGGRLLSAGGRVLNLVARSGSLEESRRLAYAAAAELPPQGLLLRRDIGAAGLLDGAAARSLGALSVYARSGVDIDAGNRAVELMRDAVTSTYGPEVLAGIGSFGGLYEATALKSLDRPVLVASTDGVGTKAGLGASLGRYAGLGEDIVNHSIDDILVQGARPLFFLDYVASSRLRPEAVAEIVGGMAKACREASCALLGGETAEMPGTYREGEIDIAGTIVGVLEAGRALPRRDLRAGDLLVGLSSSGLHTNGYSLARRALAGADLLAFEPRLGESLADALLRPHRSYLPLLRPVLEAEAGLIKALAHITGGGFTENIPRVLPPDLDAAVEMGSWPIPPIFELLRERSGAGEEEMARVFNLGIGMVAVLAPVDLGRLRDLVPEECFVIGRLEPGRGRTVLR